MLLLLGGAGAGLQAQAFEEHEIPLPVEAQGTQGLRLFSDHQGFIWLGTDQALYRYEGRDYQKWTFAPADTSTGAITAMYRDSSGVIWVGDAQGALYASQDGVLQERWRFPDSAAVVQITQGPQGLVWAASQGRGLALKRDNQEWQQPAHQPRALAAVYRLLAHQKALWAATDYGLFKIRPTGDSLRAVALEGLPDQIVKWIDTNGRQPLLGFYEALVQQGIPADSIRPAPGLDAAKVLQTHSLTWWLSERGKLYHAFTNTPFRQTQVGLQKSNPIQDITLDREGHLWVASRTGLYRINLWLTRYQQGKPITALSLGDSMLYQASAGRIQAIKVRTGETEELFQLPHQVLTLWLQPGAPFLWVGTFTGGLYRWHIHQRRLQNFTEADGLVNNNVLSLAGNQNRLWIGTLGGVGYIPLEAPETKLKTATAQDGAALQYVYKVVMDAQGRPLLATDGQGILRWEGRSFRAFTQKPTGPVVDLAIDARGCVWALDREGALCGFTPDGKKMNLPAAQTSGQASGLVVPPAGGVMVFRDGEISWYQPENQSWQHYGSAYGLGQLLPQLHAQVLVPSGAVLCGTERGITVIQPAMLKAIPWPRTYLQEVGLFLNPTRQHHFKANQNHLTFHYLGRWYIRPEAVRYRVMLEGYDLDWSISKNTQITYPRLPPGDYIFKVIAGVNGHYPSDQMQRYAFSVAAPWYQRWYGMTAIFLLGVGSIGGGLRWQLRRNARRQRQEQERVWAQYEALRSQVNPHFLFNSFNTLMALIEDEPQLASHYLQGLSDFFRSILHYRDTDLISVAEELRMVRTFLELQHIRFGEALRVDIQISPTAQATAIPPLTLQLLVENALKHNKIAQQSPLLIEIFDTAEALVVRNPQQARATKPPSTGYGLDAIIRKYRFYHKQPVKVSAGAQYFTVYLPLLPPLPSPTEKAPSHNENHDVNPRL